jgi:valyl-tRNA synthetase
MIKSFLFQVDDVEIKGKTLLSVPGYDKKVPFGLLTSLNYPIENSSKL